MRSLTTSAFAALTLLAPALAWAQPDQPLQTPDRAGQASPGVAAAAPLHDLNLMSQKIPPLLIEVMDDPYARPASLSCAALASHVDALDAALGEDYDTAAKPNETREERRARMARAGLHAGSEALLPFSGVIRTVSGAAKHDRLVLDAIMAGQARRAYLKGLGEARGCGSPASPVHTARISDQGALSER